MAQYTTKDIRNIALAGQGGAGKTTLAEALLHHVGAINSPGAVENGNTVCDFDPLEKEHQHSLNAAMACFEWQEKQINLIDTPGFPDFIAHSLGAFPAVETVAVVIDAHAGIGMLTRRMLEYADQRKLCRMIIVNKIDQEEADLASLVADIKETFGNECLPLNLPAENGTKVVDCFFNPTGDSDFGSVSDAHTQIIDQVVEVDEALMEIYLEQGELAPEQLHDPFEKALREGHLIPICFVSAASGAGVSELLEIFNRLMPSPLEGNPRPFFKGEGEDAQPFHAEPDPEQHVLAHVFKVASDPFMGKLGLFRIHQGTIGKDSQLFVGDGRKPIKINRLFRLQGKRQIEVARGMPGDICAVAKVDALHVNAVLHNSHDEDHIHLQPLKFPVPMHGLAITGKRGEEQKVSIALQKLEAEDPCLLLEHDASLNQTVLRGLGELHLRVALERMRTQYNVTVETSVPKIPYRETIRVKAEGHCRHKKQTGGAGQFGEVFLRVEPKQRDTGFEFVNAITGGVIPSVFLPAIEKGIYKVLGSGAIAGYPLQDIRVTVYDGKFHSVDSKEIAFVSAGKKAFLDAVKKARPQVLEPIVKIEVIAPEGDMGAITGNLASKRAHIQGSDVRPGHMVSIKAEAPLSELSHYQTELKSATGGHGSFSMEFSHYEPLPPNLQQQMTAEFRPEEEQD